MAIPAEIMLAKIVDRLTRCSGTADAPGVAAMARQVLDAGAYGLDDHDELTPVSPQAIRQLRAQGLPSAFVARVADEAAARQTNPALKTMTQVRGRGFVDFHEAIASEEFGSRGG
jgi:hypothetical protein